MIWLISPSPFPEGTTKDQSAIRFNIFVTMISRSTGSTYTIIKYKMVAYEYSETIHDVCAVIVTVMCEHELLKVFSNGGNKLVYVYFHVVID